MRAIAWMLLMVVCVCSFAADNGTDEKEDKKVNLYGYDFVTKPFWGLSKSYRLKFATHNILAINEDCGQFAAAKVKGSGVERYWAGSKSIFKELKSGDGYKIIQFTFVETDIGEPHSEPSPDGGDDRRYAVIDRPYRLCLGDGALAVPDYAFKRAGGMDTGMLVVPFKLRDGDLFGNTTVGPYIAFSGSSFSLLGTLGLTQVTVSDLSAPGETKTETGVSGAVGLVWKIEKYFDVALIVGVDHLSGTAGEQFEYQDERWLSFSIGYNFTR